MLFRGIRFEQYRPNIWLKIAGLRLLPKHGWIIPDQKIAHMGGLLDARMARLRISVFAGATLTRHFYFMKSAKLPTNFFARDKVDPAKNFVVDMRSGVTLPRSSFRSQKCAVRFYN
jgi:hypothetical protein